MSKPTRTASKEYKSADADIILISSDNCSYAVHKANLARSPVFRDMFDIASGGSAGRDSDGAVGEVSKRASKRVKVAEAAGKLPEIEMAENAELLDTVLPLFYEDQDDVNFEYAGFPDPADDDVTQQRCDVAKFFDKFPLHSGKVALYFHIQARLCVIEFKLGCWDEEFYTTETLVAYFIAAHYKFRHLRSLAAHMIARMFCVTRPFINDDNYANIVRLANNRCFNDTEERYTLIRALASRFASIAYARTELVKKHILPTLTMSLAVRECPGRLALYHEWHLTDEVIEALEMRVCRGINPRHCICGGQCEVDRAAVFDGLVDRLNSCVEAFGDEYPLA